MRVSGWPSSAASVRKFSFPDNLGENAGAWTKAPTCSVLRSASRWCRSTCVQHRCGRMEPVRHASEEESLERGRKADEDKDDGLREG